MNYTVDIKGETVTITMSGRFTFSDYQIFANIKQELAQMNVRNITIDFKSVNFIDSSAIGMLMHLQDEAKGRQQVLTVRNSVSPQVDRALDIARIKVALNVVKS